MSHFMFFCQNSETIKGRHRKCTFLHNLKSAGCVSLRCNFFFNESLPTHCSSQMNAAHSCRATGLLWELWGNDYGKAENDAGSTKVLCAREDPLFSTHNNRTIFLSVVIFFSAVSLLGHTGRVCHVEEDHRWGTEQSCGPANSLLLLMSTFCSGGNDYISLLRWP